MAYESLGWLEQQGLGQPESMPGKLGVIAAQFALGTLTASVVAEKDWKHVGPLGGIIAVASCYLADTVLPLTGFLYWTRALAIPSGAGALMGLYLKQRMEARFEEGSLDALTWSRQLRSGEA